MRSLVADVCRGTAIGGARIAPGREGGCNEEVTGCDGLVRRRASPVSRGVTCSWPDRDRFAAGALQGDHHEPPAGHPGRTGETRYARTAALAAAPSSSDRISSAVALALLPTPINVAEAKPVQFP
jgi:hypothetical protein